MANAVYPKWKEAIIQASSNSSLSGTVKCALINTSTYTYSSTHQFYSDLSGVVGTDQTIGSQTYTSGTFSGANLTYTSVSGSTVSAIVIYISTGTAGTSRLVLYLDTSQTGLPVTPNGGNITITWSGSGIFTISDRRLKENIREVGKVHGILPCYEYNYLGSEEKCRGFLAQEVEQIAPEAVVQVGPWKAVNYRRAIEACDRLAA